MADKKLFEYLTPEMLEKVTGGVITEEFEKLLRVDLSEAKANYSLEETIDMIRKYSNIDAIIAYGSNVEEVIEYTKAHWGDL